jgi:hypothetical protein
MFHFAEASIDAKENACQVHRSPSMTPPHTFLKLVQHGSDEPVVCFLVAEVWVSFVQANQDFLCSFEDMPHGPHQRNLTLPVLYARLIDAECIDQQQLSIS